MNTPAPASAAPAWRDRVDAFWARTFGSDGGDRVVGHRGALTGYTGCYAVARGGVAMVSAPPDLAASVAAWHPTAATAIDADWWRARLPGWSVLGPSVHAFTATAPPVTVPDGWELRPAGPGDLDALGAAVPRDEWIEGGFGTPVPRAWVAVSGAHIGAAANLTEFDGAPSDVGVATAPEFRGRGLGAAVAAAATSAAVGDHGIARWRALTTNTASRHLADRLGFTADCLQLAARPPSTTVWLRPLTTADIATHNAGEDAATVRWLTGGVGTEESTRRHFAMLNENLAAQRGKRGFGVWLGERLAGYIDLDPRSQPGIEPGEINLSYAVHPWARGRGVAAAAVEECCRYAAGQGLAAAAVIRVEAENVASIRVAEKAGFAPAGDCRDGDARLVRFRRALRPDMG